MKDLEDAKQIVGEVAGRIHNKQGLCPLYKDSTGKQLKQTPHLREIIGYFEVFLSAWILLRETALPLLTPLLNRFDVNAFVWFFEISLPLYLYSYDIPFKNGNHEVYDECLSVKVLEAIMKQRHNYDRSLFNKIDHREYLRRVKHNLFHLDVENGHLVDEAFMETGVNAILATIINKTVGNKAARAKALIWFFRRLDEGVSQAMEHGGEKYRTCSFTGRRLGDLIHIAETILVQIIERMKTATEEQLPRRVQKGRSRPTFKTEAWVAWTLTNTTKEQVF